MCPEMVVLPLGSFTMGAPLEESAYLHSLFRDPNAPSPLGLRREGPQHEVEVDIPVAMGRNEVTFGEWMACVAERGCRRTPDQTVIVQFEPLKFSDPEHPVFGVSYFDAQQYARWLNMKVGADVYRLPTEAEWEYAARSGTTTPFAQGETLTTDQANFTPFVWNGVRNTSAPGHKTMPLTVDQLDAANAWGLRHMSGNVAEWTLSCFAERHLGLATTSAYLSAARAARGCRRTLKGGNFSAREDYARPAYRGRRPPDQTVNSLGFRVLREM